MKVVYYQRKPMPGNFSIEKLFKTIRENLPPDLDPVIAVSRYESKGVFRRIFNIFEAYWRQGDINHVTGDIHYICYLLNKRKTILTVHDCGIINNSVGIKKHIIKLLWYKFPSRLVSIITVISDSTKHELEKISDFPIDKVHVIPDCISNTYTHSPKIFNYKKPKILQIGTKRNKNIYSISQALSGIPCCLDIIGMITEEQKYGLNKAGIEYTNISNILEKDLIKKYIECDIVSFVSTYEGFGLPILEGNAIGRPVVTSNISPMKEVAGESACLVDPFEISEIRKGFIRVIEDSSYREELISKGLNNVRRFRPETIANMYTELYRKMVSI